ncbi:MAG: ribonuclease P protein component [Candidatus Paceibacterota bacterium]|jgi:ribonuclease P protein component
MLSKTKRVKKALFPKVFSSGKAFHSPYLTMRIVPSRTSPPRPDEMSRFSFVASKAVAKNAVDRNLLRRRGYAAISKLGNLLPSGLIIVFFYKKGADKLPYALICREIEGTLGKAGLLK